MRSERRTSARVIVAGVAVTAFAWLIYSISVAPLLAREGELRGKLKDDRDRIERVRRSLDEIKQQEQDTAYARAELLRMHGGAPEGSALAWFPNRMKLHFDRLGIANSSTRLNSATDEPEMSGYQRTYWAVDLPIPATSAGISNLLIAVAEMERAEPLLKVIDLAIRQDDDSRRLGVINLAALMRK